MLPDGIRWIFFDIGYTLMDETESYRGWFQNASDAIGGALSAAELRRRYLEGMAKYAPAITEHLRPYGFTGSSTAHLYPKELERLYPQAKPLLLKLAKRYRLGVIANQLAGLDKRLEAHGIAQYFDFLLGSADVGLSKPDPRIFALALEKAGCAPYEAVMIGDRPDNDVYPAKRLGLRTIRVRQGVAACQVPRSPEYEADATVDNLDALGGILL